MATLEKPANSLPNATVLSAAPSAPPAELHPDTFLPSLLTNSETCVESKDEHVTDLNCNEDAVDGRLPTVEDDERMSANKDVNNEKLSTRKKADDGRLSTVEDDEGTSMIEGATVSIVNAVKKVISVPEDATENGTVKSFVDDAVDTNEKDGVSSDQNSTENEIKVKDDNSNEHNNDVNSPIKVDPICIGTLSANNTEGETDGQRVNSDSDDFNDEICDVMLNGKESGSEYKNGDTDKDAQIEKDREARLAALNWGDLKPKNNEGEKSSLYFTDCADSRLESDDTTELYQNSEFVDSETIEYALNEASQEMYKEPTTLFADQDASVMHKDIVEDMDSFSFNAWVAFMKDMEKRVAKLEKTNTDSHTMPINMWVAPKDNTIDIDSNVSLANDFIEFM